LRNAVWVLLVSMAACGGATATCETSGGSGGGSGVAVGGASGSADSGGSGGGAAGTVGASGGGGTAVADASAGVGGASGGESVDAGIKPECYSEKDCKIFTDCCACEGVPNAETPASCRVACKQNQCAALGLAAPQAACIAGRCVVGFDCDSSKVLCKSVPPQCPAGQVPLVNSGCWQGTCVAANECASVKDCSACTGGLICAEFIQRGGPAVHCYDVPKECNGNYGCSCAGAGVCSGPGLTCGDLSGLMGIACSCPAC